MCGGVREPTAAIGGSTGLWACRQSQISTSALAHARSLSLIASRPLKCMPASLQTLAAACMQPLTAFPVCTLAPSPQRPPWLLSCRDSLRAQAHTRADGLRQAQNCILAACICKAPSVPRKPTCPPPTHRTRVTKRTKQATGDGWEGHCLSPHKTHKHATGSQSTTTHPHMKRT